MDREVFRLAAESAEYAEYAEPIPEGTEAALMLEFDSEVVDSRMRSLGRRPGSWTTERRSTRSRQLHP